MIGFSALLGQPCSRQPTNVARWGSDRAAYFPLDRLRSGRSVASFTSVRRYDILVSFGRVCRIRVPASQAL